MPQATWVPQNLTVRSPGTVFLKVLMSNWFFFPDIFSSFSPLSFLPVSAPQTSSAFHSSSSATFHQPPSPSQILLSSPPQITSFLRELFLPFFLFFHILCSFPRQFQHSHSIIYAHVFVWSPVLHLILTPLLSASCLSHFPMPCSPLIISNW